VPPEGANILYTVSGSGVINQERIVVLWSPEELLNLSRFGRSLDPPKRDELTTRSGREQTRIRSPVYHSDLDGMN
jgi:hypothetical protein